MANDYSAAHFLRSLALLSFSGSLLAMGTVYSYLATDGWYDAKVGLVVLLFLVPFIAFVVWMAARVRSQAKEFEGERPAYLSVVKRTGVFLAWFSAAAIVVGLIASFTTLYGGLIFMAVLLLGVPGLIACAFLFSWLSWLFGGFCMRSRAEDRG